MKVNTSPLALAFEINISHVTVALLAFPNFHGSAVDVFNVIKVSLPEIQRRAAECSERHLQAAYAITAITALIRHKLVYVSNHHRHRLVLLCTDTAPPNSDFEGDAINTAHSSITFTRNPSLS